MSKTYFKMEISLDEENANLLFKIHELIGSSNTPKKKGE